MEIYPDHIAARQALNDFAINRPEGCPADIFDAITSLPTVNLVGWGALLEAIYFADRGTGDATTVGPILMQIAAGNLLWFAYNQWLAIGESGDAGKMRLALIRDAGEEAPVGTSWPDPADDPVRIVIPEPPVPPSD